MTKPLALIYYFNLLPGTQIANRLYELGYRVQVVESGALGQVVEIAAKETPLLFLTEAAPPDPVCATISALKGNPATQHIPVLAYASKPDKSLQVATKTAGASLLANSQGLVDQLAQLLDQILMVE